MKNGPLDVHPQVHGEYQLSAVPTNGHPSWTSSTHAIWYSIGSKQWVIGTFQAIGTDKSTFRGKKQADDKLRVHDTSDPPMRGRKRTSYELHLKLKLST